jgi:hypothetical protein
MRNSRGKMINQSCPRIGWDYEYTLVISALRRLRQEDHKFKATLNHRTRQHFTPIAPLKKCPTMS